MSTEIIVKPTIAARFLDIFNHKVSEARAANTSPAVTAYIRPILETQEPWWDGLTDNNCWENLQRVDPALWGNYFLISSDAGDNPLDGEKHLPYHARFFLEKKRQLESFTAAGGKFLDREAPKEKRVSDALIQWAPCVVEDREGYAAYLELREGYAAYRELFVSAVKAGVIQKSDIEKSPTIWLGAPTRKDLLQAFPA